LEVVRFYEATKYVSPVNPRWVSWNLYYLGVDRLYATQPQEYLLKTLGGSPGTLTWE